ncbi:enoyl-CoA hydratase-related protein [Candidatus Poriferisocius sp.]|uniref:enoyl-CoA hydratase-related protein n=1 Tax=Candidatus Poriferisocius sp. TaxID=3101276 RepID=UPI003B012260
MSSPVLVSGLAEARALLSQPYAGEDLGLASCPMILVEPTAADLTQPTPTGLADLIGNIPAIIALSLPRGIDIADAPEPADLRECFDMVLSPDDLTGPAAVPTQELDRITTAAAASPAAAVTLVQLLRLGENLPTVDGLVAESLAYSTLQSGPMFRDWLTTQPQRQPSNPPARPVPAQRTSLSDPPPAVVAEKTGPADPPPPVVAERTGSTLRLTLNRPQRHNAFSAEMRDGLVEQLRAAWADPGLDGIVLDGAGPTFCSGGDLAEFGTTPDPATAHRIRSVRSAAFWLDRLAAKTRVLVHGTCVGAGVELPAYAHDVIAHPSTTFRLPEVAMGLVPGAGGTVSLARRIGRQRLCYLALTNREIDATTALSWGLIDRIQH